MYQSADSVNTNITYKHVFKQLECIRFPMPIALKKKKIKENLYTKTDHGKIRVVGDGRRE